MRYVFVGKKIPHVGKTLWELVGNLKNFGVGRLIKKSNTLSDPALSFCKILKVLPFPPSKDPFASRKVIVWYEEIFKGRHKGILKVSKNTDIPKYHLIPRMEEEEYLKKAEELESSPVKYVKKYCSWPPLYKELWKQKEAMNQCQPIPKLKLKTAPYERCNVIKVDEEAPFDTCSLYKSELSVDEMYREVVKLKKLIKANTAMQEQ